MLKSILISIGIISVSAVIPVLLFFTFPLSPFIAGYFGIKFAQIPKAKYASRCLLFGSSIGFLFLIPATLLSIIMTKIYGLGSHHGQIIIAMVIVTALYSGSMSTLGAMYSVLKRDDN